MREVTIPLLKEFQKLIPVVFDDILKPPDAKKTFVQNISQVGENNTCIGFVQQFNQNGDNINAPGAVFDLRGGKQ
jgi:hypothetical protein